MKLDYKPLLAKQRELHGLPRNQERFQTYLRTIFPPGEAEDQLLPLAIMNPMGRDHVTAMLDSLLAMNADEIGRQAALKAETQLLQTPGEYKVALVVADDLKGGWTNRWDCEFKFRFDIDRFLFRQDPTQRPRWLKDYWIAGVLWSSEIPTESRVRESILAAAHRAAYIHNHRPARNLREMLAQEGTVMAKAGCSQPILDPEDLEYTRQVLEPFLDASDMPTCLECLFGDEAAHSLGFTPHGLSPWAGMALALHDSEHLRP